MPPLPATVPDITNLLTFREDFDTGPSLRCAHVSRTCPQEPIMHTRRRFLFAGATGLAALAALTSAGRRALLAQRRRRPGGRRLRSHPQRRRMASAADARPVRDPARSRHRAAVQQPAERRAPARHVRVRGLPAPAVLVDDEIRQPHRLAELLGAARSRGHHEDRPVVRNDPHRSAVPPLRRPPRPRVRRRAEADRAALLHERPRTHVPSDPGLIPPRNPTETASCCSSSSPISAACSRS